MINFVDEYMIDANAHNDEGLDEQKILLRSMSRTLNLIIENELTQRQSECLKMFYVKGKSQQEIANELKLSQPTVSRHIAKAKEITNKYLGYCYFSVNKANEQWLSQ